MFKQNTLQNQPRRSSRSALLLICNSLLILSLACALPNILQGGKETPPPGSQAVNTPAAPTPTPQPLPPALVESDPPIGGELPLKGPLTLYFNQPMERSSVEASLAKQASLAGELTWVDDSTLVIDPGNPLAPESVVNLSIGTQARSASGLALTQPISLTYQTAGYLRVTQSLPEGDAEEVDPTSAVVSTFNRPVVPLGADSSELPAAFTLEPSAEGRGEWLNTSTYIFYPDPGLEGGKTYTVQVNPDLLSTDGSPLESAYNWSFTTANPRMVSIQPSTPGTPARLDAEVILTFNQPMDTASVEATFQFVDPSAAQIPGEITWSEENTVLTFKPDNLLARSTVYRGALDGQAQAMGGTTLGETTTFELQTVPNLSIVSSDPPQGGQKPPYNAVLLRFSGPIAAEDIQRSLTISPTVTNLSTFWDEEQLTLNIYGDFDPSANYSLSLSPDVADPWGGTLGQAYTLNFTTAPLDPQFILTTGTDILFLTPQDSSLVVQVTNLASIPLSMGRVPLEDFMTMVSPNGYDLRNTFQSPDEVSWDQPLEAAANLSQAVNVFISPDQQPLAPGIYYLRFSFTQPNLYPSTFLLVVSNIHLTYKLSATDTLVWAVDLRTETPLQAADISLYDENGNQMAAGQTDAEGIFAASVPARENPYSNTYAVLGQPGEESFGLALSSWTQGVNAYDFGIISDLRPPRQHAYLYTDRPIYRPGQTVYFRGVVRQAYNGRYRLPDQNSVQLKLHGPYGTELETIDLALSALGTGHGQYVLTEDAPPGYYTISMVDSDWDSSISFQVADYRKPEINLQVNLGASEQVQAGSTLSATVNARYFFDAPAGNVPVKWALYAARSFFDLPGYQVGAQDNRWLDAYQFPIFGDSLGLQVATGEGTTDAQGLLTLDVPSVFDLEQAQYDPSQRQKLTLEVTIQDESGLPVSARDEVQVNPAEIYIGLRPDAWVGQAGQVSSYEVQVVDWDGNPAGVHSLHAEFQKVVWVREDPTGPYLMPVYTPQYTPVGSTDFTTNDQGLARIAFTPEDPGTYQIDVTGDGSLTQFILWVGGPGQAVWPNLPNQRLRLTADRQSYQPGDTAQVFVPNPFGASVSALMSVERSIVLSHQLITLDPGGTTISLPISADEAPNVFVSVTLLGRTSDGKPDFRQGYVELAVEPVEQTLNVTLTSQPQRVGPGDEVSFDVLVTDSAGQPVEGEFSLAVVDLAALALADPNSKDIVPAFYEKQPLGVQTGLALAAYANRQSNLPVGGGGGGGDEVPPVLRESFPDTAYWNAEIVTGPDGSAHVAVRLPDTLTTWKVDLRGLTADTRVGQAQSEIVSSKDLLVRPVTPRFLVVDDHVQLAAIVQNNTQSPLEAEVGLQASGVDLDDPSTAAQSVSVPPGGRTRVEWWGTVQDVESAELVFSAAAGGLQDLTRPASGALPVLHYAAPQTFATTGVMDEGDERLELVSLPRSFDPRGGSLNVELAPSLGTAMLNALDALEHFPYECTEQTISRFLPNLETYRVLQQFGISSPDVKARLDRTLDEGLQSLLARQNTMDGGWSWWMGGESDPFVSAYVLFGLVRAREAGFSISQDVIQRGLDYLRSTMTPPASLDETWQLDRLAFENFVLAQAAEAGFGSADPSAASALYERRDELNPWAQAYLALTYESLAAGSEEAKTLISDLESAAVRTATGAHWEEKEPSLQNMSTPISTSAIVLYALAQRDPGTPLLAEAVRYLMANRQGDGAWASTFSTAWSLMGLSQVIRGTGELGGDFTFSASVNGAPVASGQAGSGGAGISPPVMASVPLSSLYADNPNALVIRREPGTGRLYYAADLRVNRPVDTVVPLNRGISVSRATYPTGEACTAQSCPAVQTAQSGEQVKVRVTLTIPNDSYYLLVEDYIPAGAEILDTSLKTSQQGELFPLEQEEPEPLFNPRRPFEEGWGWWLFKDPQIYDDHIAWAVDYLPAGTYELTYTLTILQPGEYRVLPARAWQFYFPEVQGTSAGELFGIEP